MRRPAALIDAARRWLYEPPDSVAAPSPGLRALATDARRLASELFQGGGATIDTPPDQAAGSPLAVRTVVQADGDVICLVDERHCADVDLRRAHGRQVDAWFVGVGSTLRGTTEAVRTAAVSLGLATGLAAGTAAGTLWGAVGVSALAVPAFRAAAGWAVRRALRRALR